MERAVGKLTKTKEGFRLDVPGFVRGRFEVAAKDIQDFLAGNTVSIQRLDLGRFVIASEDIPPLFGGQDVSIRFIQPCSDGTDITESVGHARLIGETITFWIGSLVATARRADVWGVHACKRKTAELFLPEDTTQT